MSRYESGVKFIAAPSMAVYDRLADLSQLQRVADSLTDEQKAAIRQKIEEQGKGMVRLDNFRCDADSVSVDVMGSPVTLRIVDRELGKTVKYAAENSPLPLTLWVQILPKDAGVTKVKVTLDADIPFFLKPMIGSKLDGAADQLAEMLTRIPY